MRVEIGPILRTDFCAQGYYSSIDAYTVRLCYATGDVGCVVSVVIVAVVASVTGSYRAIDVVAALGNDCCCCCFCNCCYYFVCHCCSCFLRNSCSCFLLGNSASATLLILQLSLILMVLMILVLFRHC